MRLWWVSMSLFMELAGEQGKVVTSISTSIQLSMEEVFSMSKWSDRVSRRSPCSRNVVSIVGLDVVVVVVVYLLLGQSRE